MKRTLKRFIKKCLGSKWSYIVSKHFKSDTSKYRDNLPLLAEKIYYNILGRRIDWNNPKDINEKINWMKFNTDTSMWTILADKYKVREFLTEKGYGDLLVPVVGKWDRADEINFEDIKYPCILKVNHGAGGNYPLMAKPTESEIASLIQNLNKLLDTPYGYDTAEPHYIPIKTCVIAEEFLIEEKKNQHSSSLIDYKVWCFNGVADSILAVFDRAKYAVKLSNYDKDWNFHPEWAITTSHYLNGGDVLPKPLNLQKMLDAAAALSKGFPQIRVDFYEVNGKLYIGEMTFTSQGGYMEYYTQEHLLDMGNKCII